MTIKLRPDLEARLKDEAQRRGVDPNDCANEVLDLGLPLRSGDNQATLDLLAQWDEEEATDDPVELERRRAEAEEFMQNLSRNRIEMEGLDARKLWP